MIEYKHNQKFFLPSFTSWQQDLETPQRADHVFIGPNWPIAAQQEKGSIQTMEELWSTHCSHPNTQKNPTVIRAANHSASGLKLHKQQVQG